MEKTPPSIIHPIHGENCEWCKKFADAVHVDSDFGRFCYKCYIQLHRPKIHFIERDNSNVYWSRENQAVESVLLSDLEMCGWFLREKITEYSNINNLVVNTYIMEFYGKIACPRCTHVNFPSHITPCRNKICSKITEKQYYYDAAEMGMD